MEFSLSAKKYVYTKSIMMTFFRAKNRYFAKYKITAQLLLSFLYIVIRNVMKRFC